VKRQFWRPDASCGPRGAREKSQRDYAYGYWAIISRRL
jgi:hypothetical protein